MDMEVNISSNTKTKAAAAKRPRSQKKVKKASVFLTLILYTFIAMFTFGMMFSLWFFLTESGTNFRFMMADTIITTQHRYLAKYLIGDDELQKRVDRYWKQFDAFAEVKDQNLVNVIKPSDTKAAVAVEKKPLVEIEPISGSNFKGKLLIVNDPKKLRIAVPGTQGKGEKVSSMVKRLGAVAGVNAGGFVDPEWKGNGFQPTGLVMSGGKIYYNDGDMETSNHIVAIDKEGRMIAGKYKPSELLRMGIQEAVTFAPRFIVNGVGQIKSQADGWGIAPRTAMAQKADGTIMFAIIDGRQPGYSIGATLFDIQKVFLDHGAVTAANLDGGSSTVLVHNNEIVNRPSSEYGERYLPTAWLVFDNPNSVYIRNIWEGLDPSKIDPSKW
jgi:exopolysaccharide biosynthesis protein